MENITSTPKYDQYIDSGYEWIGEIPLHWDLGKLGSCLFPVSVKNCPELPLLSITREQGVIERDVDDQESNHNFIPDDLSGYKKLEKGQFGMNKMKAWQGSYGVSKFTGIVSPAYFVFDFTKAINPEFFNWAIRSKLYVSFFGSASDGVRIGQWDLSKTRMKVIPFVLPSEEEQSLIANFLDKKTALIDEAISIKEQQISLLKERKQIIIQQAVTQGLDPNVPMKDSGVDWIGEIPEHWEVLPLTKYSTRVDYRGKTPEKVELGRFLLTAKNIKNGYIDYDASKEYIREEQYEKVMSRGKPRIGDLLFTTEAPLGSTALVDDTSVAIAQRLILFRLSRRFVSGYVNLYMQTTMFQNFLQKLGTGSTALGIKASKFCFLKLVTPPEKEQLSIFQFAEKVSNETNSAIAVLQQQIDKLKEYKTTLNNSAVTGKIKITPEMVKQ